MGVLTPQNSELTAFEMGLDPKKTARGFAIPPHVNGVKLSSFSTIPPDVSAAILGPPRRPPKDHRGIPWNPSWIPWEPATRSDALREGIRWDLRSYHCEGGDEIVCDCVAFWRL